MLWTPDGQQVEKDVVLQTIEKHISTQLVTASSSDRSIEAELKSRFHDASVTLSIYKEVGAGVVLCSEWSL